MLKCYILFGEESALCTPCMYMLWCGQEPRTPWVTGFAICLRLTLQVYLHMVDPTRDRYLMNKSADVLVKTCGVRSLSSTYIPVASGNARLPQQKLASGKCSCS